MPATSPAKLYAPEASVVVVAMTVVPCLRVIVTPEIGLLVLSNFTVPEMTAPRSENPNRSAPPAIMGAVCVSVGLVTPWAYPAGWVSSIVYVPATR